MFWEKYVKLCANKGTSPNAVAKELSISSGAVTNWKKGATPHDTKLKRIADYFGVSVDYLIGNEDTPASPIEAAASVWDLDEREQILLTTFRSTTEEGRQLIIQSVLNIRDEMLKKSSYSAQNKAAE